ncbi:MAG: hypothetical protein ABIP90_04395 [Vicinamibacterales bacterium]
MDLNALAALPGADLVMAGLRDTRAGVDSPEARLIQIGAINLRARGLDVPRATGTGSPEHELYDLLERTYGKAAHSRYNALIRRLVSFERALACASR